jgi:hypothetical protein
MCVVHTVMYCVYKNIAGDAVLYACGKTILCMCDMFVVVLQH